jgi:hypothetical protein
LNKFIRDISQRSTSQFHVSDPAGVINNLPNLFRIYATIIDSVRRNESSQRRGFDNLIELAFEETKGCHLEYVADFSCPCPVASLSLTRVESLICLRANTTGIAATAAKAAAMIVRLHTNKSVKSQLHKAANEPFADNFCLFDFVDRSDTRIGYMPFEYKPNAEEARNQLLLDCSSILCHRRALCMTSAPVYGGTVVRGFFQLWVADWSQEEPDMVRAYIIHCAMPKPTFIDRDERSPVLLLSSSLRRCLESIRTSSLLELGDRGIF